MCLVIVTSVTLLPFSTELTQEDSGKQAQLPAFRAHVSDSYPHGVAVGSEWHWFWGP